MTAFNLARLRVKPGREEQVVDARRDAEANLRGVRHVALVKTDERACCVIGEWEDTASLTRAGANDALLNRFGTRWKTWEGLASPTRCRGTWWWKCGGQWVTRPQDPSSGRQGNVLVSSGCSIGCQSELDPHRSRCAGVPRRV
jgi:hypothetical protein